MKPHKVLLLALIVSVALAVSAQAGSRHQSSDNAPTTSTHYSRSAVYPGSGFRYGGSRTFAPSPRMSMRTFPQQRVFSGGNASFAPRQFTPRTFRGGNGNGLAEFQNSRPIQSGRFGQMQGQRGNRVTQLGTGRGNRIGNISPGHNHVFAQQSGGWHRDWDRNHDHFWNGHRCRFVNGSWFIFDFGFLPWWGWPYSDYYAPYGYGYGYGYPYGSGYEYDSGGYDGSYYDGQNNYDSSYNDQGGYDSSYNGRNRSGSYDRSAAAMVADVQALLERERYYHGQIDGVLGPETRHALVRYQSAKGLEPSGNLTSETVRSLGLQERVARE
jgi:Putative peptidoglycan binding domain